ncbi:LuxR C-terminal-related transcriptional regulator [Gracilibacillus thailandensis]|jgi:two-component system, NarL family, response regulator DegU|uniref:DNA-binding response regulator n=1 Tax=Gracilibacillus thailandensis TaxID=563735 RepID=A0A6N7R147_9BACI|nr:response regulator transcription factor [Gracilibacillus thailandensis]MRI67332.1 DNA-binding response regulator [Gracilibacillus thailandensis]
MRIAIVKEASIYREGLVGVLSNEFKTYDIIAVEPQQQGKLRDYIIDLLIIDIDTDIDTISLINTYMKNNKKIIVWTEDNDHPDLTELFKMDLNGYFFNGMEKQELVHAIEKIISGQNYIHEELTQVLLGDYREIHSRKDKRPVGVFTNREWEVMELLTQGYSNNRISSTLYITDKTVKNHISSILRKLEVPDRTNAVITALKNQWFHVS